MCPDAALFPYFWLTLIFLSVFVFVFLVMGAFEVEATMLFLPVSLWAYWTEFVSVSFMYFADLFVSYT